MLPLTDLDQWLDIRFPHPLAWLQYLVGEGGRESDRGFGRPKDVIEMGLSITGAVTRKEPTAGIWVAIFGPRQGGAIDVDPLGSRITSDARSPKPPEPSVFEGIGIQEFELFDTAKVGP